MLTSPELAAALMPARPCWLVAPKITSSTDVPPLLGFQAQSRDQKPTLLVSAVCCWTPAVVIGWKAAMSPVVSRLQTSEGGVAALNALLPPPHDAASSAAASNPPERAIVAVIILPSEPARLTDVEDPEALSIEGARLEVAGDARRRLAERLVGH